MKVVRVESGIASTRCNRIRMGAGHVFIFVHLAHIRIRLFSGTKPIIYTCKRTNVKQVGNINIHYIKDKMLKQVN